MKPTRPISKFVSSKYTLPKYRPAIAMQARVLLFAFVLIKMKSGCTGWMSDTTVKTSYFGFISPNRKTCIAKCAICIYFEINSEGRTSCLKNYHNS